VNKQEIIEYIKKLPECDECKIRPTMHLAFDGVLLSGCDNHMVELGEMLYQSHYYNKNYVNYDFKDRGNKAN